MKKKLKKFKIRCLDGWQEIYSTTIEAKDSLEAELKFHRQIGTGSVLTEECLVEVKEINEKQPIYILLTEFVIDGNRVSNILEVCKTRKEAEKALEQNLKRDKASRPEWEYIKIESGYVLVADKNNNLNNFMQATIFEREV